jgi:hypothetical protein
MQDVLKCYVSGRPLPNSPGQGVISFAVPDYGLLFRSLTAGNHPDLEIAALISFLRFAAFNREVFGDRRLRIYSDHPPLAEMLKGKPGAAHSAPAREAAQYARQLHYTVEWIGRDLNRAAASVTTIPDLPTGARLPLKASVGVPAEPLLGDRRNGRKQ